MSGDGISYALYHPDQQIHNIYVLIIFYIPSVFLHVSMHLHHLQEVLTLCFAEVTKLLKLSNLQLNKSNSYSKIQQDATVYQNLLFHVYMKLSVFRATHRPSSGANLKLH
jgi:hypothetical protein